MRLTLIMVLGGVLLGGPAVLAAQDKSGPAVTAAFEDPDDDLRLQGVAQTVLTLSRDDVPASSQS